MRTPESGKDTNVLSKTSEEIKNGLKCLRNDNFPGEDCKRCPYLRHPEENTYACNIPERFNDTWDYIKQLEAQNAELTEKAARYDELRGRIRVLRADVFLRQTEPISPTSEKEGKQKAVRRIADSLYDQRAISFRKWLFGCEVVLQGQLQIVKPEPTKELEL